MSDAPLSTSDPKVAVKIRMGEGIAGEEPKTVMSVFESTVKKNGDRPAIHQKRLHLSDKPASETPWTTWTWKQYYEQVFSFAKSLLHLGFHRYDCINIIGFNSPEWFFANFGAIAAGGIAAGIYTTNLPEACYYVSDHSKAKVVVVEGAKQLEKYLEISSRLTENLKAIVVYGEKELPAEAQNCVVPVYLFDTFLELGKDVSDTDVQARISDQKPGETCTLIYTSGTTGNPKAVMITNDNLTWTASIMLRTLPRALNNDDHIISFLPLSHIAAQMLDMHCPAGKL